MTDPGWLYVATRGRPNEFKIGLTRRGVSERESELTGCGYGLPWERPGGCWKMIHRRAAQHCGAAEARAHRMLSDCRVSEHREIFQCTEQTAREVVDAASAMEPVSRNTGNPDRPWGSNLRKPWNPPRRYLPHRKGRGDGIAWLPLMLAAAVVFVAVMQPDVRWIPYGNVARAAYLVERLTR